MQMLVFVLNFIGLILLVHWLIKKMSGRAGDDFSGNPLNPQQIKKRQENLERIMALVKEQGRIDNAAVQRTLKVSDATATRYLEYLVNLGKLSRIGERGQSVYYQIP